MTGVVRAEAAVADGSAHSPARRPLVLSCALGAVLIALVAARLMLGDYPVSLAELAVVLQGGEAGFARVVVLEWRLPRTIAGILFGGALALAGLVFQRVVRNELASPDVLGVSTGAYTGALLVLVSGGAGVALTAGAAAGGLLAAGVVLASSLRGGLPGARVVVVGIAIAAFLTSVDSWLLLTARREIAQSGAVWGTGSLSGIRMDDLLPSAIVIGAVVVVLPLLWRPLRLLSLGDAVAAALGTRVLRARLALLTAAVVLAAAATAPTGPILFVALVSPHIAARLARRSLAPVATALTGAILLSAADQVAATGLPVDVPAGTLTIVLGGSYLALLVLRPVGGPPRWERMRRRMRRRCAA